MENRQLGSVATLIKQQTSLKFCIQNFNKIANLKFCDKRKAFIFAFPVIRDDACHPINAITLYEVIFVVEYQLLY